MNKYEFVVIVNAQLPQSEKDAVAKQAADIVVKNGGKVVSSQIFLEKHKFAFAIKKCIEGTYYLVKFESEGSAVEKIKQAAHINEKILRFLISRVEQL